MRLTSSGQAVIRPAIGTYGWESSGARTINRYDPSSRLDSFGRTLGLASLADRPEKLHPRRRATKQFEGHRRVLNKVITTHYAQRRYAITVVHATGK